MGSSLGRGGCSIKSGAGGLKPSAVAGGPSVTRFTQSRCIAVRGSGKPSKVAKKMAQISPMLQLIKKQIKACILAYMRLPSSTALTMVAKLSSARIMSAASLATSVPVIPIATPMAACCSAGASFTPCRDRRNLMLW